MKSKELDELLTNIFFDIFVDIWFNEEHHKGGYSLEKQCLPFNYSHSCYIFYACLEFLYV